MRDGRVIRFHGLECRYRRGPAGSSRAPSSMSPARPATWMRGPPQLGGTSLSRTARCSSPGVRRPGFRSSPHSFCAVSVTSERAFARLSHVQQRGPRTRPWTCALRWRPTLRTSSTSGWGCECPPVARRNVREVLEQSVDDLGSLRIVDALTRAGWRRWRVRPVSWPCSGRDSLLTSLMALPVDRALPHRPPPRDGSGESVEEALRHDSRRRLLYGQSQRCPEGGRGLPAHWSRVVARARWRRRWCW